MKRVTVNFEDDDYLLVEKMAKKSHLKPTQYIRVLVLDDVMKKEKKDEKE